MDMLFNVKECCGCTACASSCAYNAISMEPDSLGFLYPKVDKTKCIGCGICERVCQFNKNYDISQNLVSPIAYAARNKDEREVMKSRSGAVFATITDYILEQGGVIYGAGYKNHFRVCHKRATTKEECDEFRGSKYVQSDLSGIFRMIKKDLKDGKIVLFSGTPCQTSGLRSYVERRIQKELILVDIVCHGVPSPFIWRDYINYIELKNNTKVEVVNFRDKVKFGWKDHKETFITKDGNCIIGGIYTNLFYKHIMFRKSCSICYFTNLKRPSDITLADFWGWEKSVPDMNIDDKGINLVIINTEKGISIINSIRQKLIINKVDINNCLQRTLQSPSFPHPLRILFESDYAKHGFRYVIKKYVTPGIARKIINKIRYGRSIL